jgi:catechol 2,3-dioxygenase-like lactoylglutathione lyase family enzyme
MNRAVCFYTEALGFVLVSDSEETVDLGAGPESLRQAILTIPQTRTILALTHASSLQCGPAGLNHLGLILGSDADVTDMVQRVPTFGGVIQKQGRRESAGICEVFAYVPLLGKVSHAAPACKDNLQQSTAPISSHHISLVRIKQGPLARLPAKGIRLAKRICYLFLENGWVSSSMRCCISL